MPTGLASDHILLSTTPSLEAYSGIASRTRLNGPKGLSSFGEVAQNGALVFRERWNSAESTECRKFYCCNGIWIFLSYLREPTASISDLIQTIRVKHSRLRLNLCGNSYYAENLEPMESRGLARGRTFAREIGARIRN